MMVQHLGASAPETRHTVIIEYCTYRYFLRDNGRNELSSSPRKYANGNDGGGFPFSQAFLGDRNMLYKGFNYLPGAQYCLGGEDGLSFDRETRFCACAPAQARSFSSRGTAGSRKKEVEIPSWAGVWKKMSMKQKDDYLMVASLREMGVNWWGADEVVEFTDVDPCGKEGTSRTVVAGGKRPDGMQNGDTSSSGTTTQDIIVAEDDGKAKGRENGNDHEQSSSASCCDGSAVEDEDVQGESFMTIDASADHDAPELPGQGARRAMQAEERETSAEEEVAKITLQFPGLGEQGDFVSSVYEFHGPLLDKIVELAHDGDLSKTAFHGDSEGGSMSIELPLYLMHKKITRAVAQHGVNSVAALVENKLPTEEARRPYCVASIAGLNNFPRPESIQGARNWKRLTEVAQVCGTLTKWTMAVATLDTVKYHGDRAVYEPHLVLHQLHKIASAGFAHVETYEMPTGHTMGPYWATPEQLCVRQLDNSWLSKSSYPIFEKLSGRGSDGKWSEGCDENLGGQKKIRIPSWAAEQEALSSSRSRSRSLGLPRRLPLPLPAPA